MGVTVEDVAGFVGCSPTEPVLPGVLAVAVTIVGEYLGVGARRCPVVVQDQAVTQLAAEIWSRRNAPGGVLQWGAEGSAPVRLARDAMSSVEPLLRRYRPLGAVG